MRNMKGNRSQVFFFTALSTNKFPMLDNGIIGKVRTLFTMTVVPGRNVSPALFPEEVVAESLSSFHLVSDLRLYPLNNARVRFNKGRSSLWLPISVLSSGDNLHFTVEMTDKSWSNHPRHWRTLKCTTIYACFFPALTNLRVAEEQ